jgi:hypothetical protein
MNSSLTTKEKIMRRTVNLKVEGVDAIASRFNEVCRGKQCTLHWMNSCGTKLVSDESLKTISARVDHMHLVLTIRGVPSDEDRAKSTFMISQEIAVLPVLVFFHLICGDPRVDFYVEDEKTGDRLLIGVVRL